MATSAGSQNRRVFVGNIPYDATEEQLTQICEEVGPVVSFRLVVDKETGKPKGYGFCEYKDEETALSARRNLQGYEINGRQLRVDFAENGKNNNADRNRDQGRGGPGMAPNLDGTRQLGDSAMHQPIGLPSSLAAASAIAVQNGTPHQHQAGPDPLTSYLSRMSRHQLLEILSEIKLLATQNNVLARQLLQGSPQLLRALFQAEIMLGLRLPQTMVNSQRPVSQISQTIPQPVALIPMQQQNPQSKVLPPPGTILGGPSGTPPVLPSVPVSAGLIPHVPVQPPVLVQPPVVLQNPRPPHQPSLVIPSASLPQPAVPPLPSSQMAKVNNGQPSQLLRPPPLDPKLRRSDDRAGAPFPPPVANSGSAVNPYLAQTVGPTSQVASSGALQQQPQKPEIPQLSPEVQSALLQQVLTLTPEQLSSLSLDQQNQVLQIQKMLSSSQ